MGHFGREWCALTLDPLERIFLSFGKYFVKNSKTIETIISTRTKKRIFFEFFLLVDLVILFDSMNNNISNFFWVIMD